MSLTELAQTTISKKKFSGIKFLKSKKVTHWLYTANSQLWSWIFSAMCRTNSPVTSQFQCDIFIEEDPLVCHVSIIDISCEQCKMIHYLASIYILLVYILHSEDWYMSSRILKHKNKSCLQCSCKGWRNIIGCIFIAQKTICKQSIEEISKLFLLQFSDQQRDPNDGGWCVGV